MGEQAANGIAYRTPYRIFLEGSAVGDRLKHAFSIFLVIDGEDKVTPSDLSLSSFIWNVGDSTSVFERWKGYGKSDKDASGD